MKKALLAIALAVATPLMFAAPAQNPPAKTASKKAHKHGKRAPKKGTTKAHAKK